MNQALSSYDINAQIKPALSKVWTWISKNEPGWGWDKNLLVQVIRQICIDNVKNSQKLVNKGLRSQGQAIKRGRPPKRQSTAKAKKAASSQAPNHTKQLNLRVHSKHSLPTPSQPINVDEFNNSEMLDRPPLTHSPTFESQLYSPSSNTLSSQNLSQSNIMEHEQEEDEDEYSLNNQEENSQIPILMRSKRQQEQIYRQEEEAEKLLTSGQLAHSTGETQTQDESPPQSMDKIRRRTGAPSLLTKVYCKFLPRSPC